MFVRGTACNSVGPGPTTVFGSSRSVGPLFDNVLDAPTLDPVGSSNSVSASSIRADWKSYRIIRCRVQCHGNI